MSKVIETSGCLTASLTLVGRPVLSVHFQHQVELKGDGRRALRALRVHAMAELAKAWTEPLSQERWRERQK